MVDLRRGRRRPGSLLLAIAAIAVLALAGGLTACGGDDDNGNGGSNGSSTAGKKVYLNAYAQVIQYFRDWEAGATARGNQLSWDVTGEFGNVTPEQQVQQVENALVKQPDAIIVTPIDEESLNPALQQAKDQDVAVITVGATSSNPDLVTSFVARDNYQIGVDKAQFMIDALQGKGQVGIVHGIRGLTFSEDMAKAYEATLAKAPGIEVVDGPFTGGFAADLGLDATANLLSAHPDLNGIIYDNDDLALGGVEAVKNAGIPLDQFVIVGTDGGDAAIKAVEAGDIDMTVNLCGYREGVSAANTLNTFFEDGSVEDRVVSPVEIFTTENAKAKSEELGLGTTREKCN
jgi:ABC-type sugar transport system substrate-binding protein